VKRDFGNRPRRRNDVLAIREPIGLVVATLQAGKSGICRDCYQVIGESWMSVCDDCRQHRHNGVDGDYEAARADGALA
jgi:hypothetical protein